MGIGRVVRSLREHQQLTQRELATSAGVSQQAVSTLELDNMPNVSAINLARLARRLGVSVEDVLVMAGILSPLESRRQLSVAATTAAHYLNLLSPLRQRLELARLRDEVQVAVGPDGLLAKPSDRETTLETLVELVAGLPAPDLNFVYRCIRHYTAAVEGVLVDKRALAAIEELRLLIESLPLVEEYAEVGVRGR